MVLGHVWKPHSKGGTHKLLNPDDACYLLSWAEENQPTTQEFIDNAGELRLNRAVIAANFLEKLDCAALAREVIDEAKMPSHLWVNHFLIDTELSLKTPEVIEAIRFKYVTTASVTKWFNDHEILLRHVNPFLLFNYDEVMLGMNDGGKIVVKSQTKCFSLKQPPSDHITVGLTVNAVGRVIPPLVILKALKNVPNCIKTDFQARNIWLGSTPSGWINRTMFEVANFPTG